MSTGFAMKTELFGTSGKKTWKVMMSFATSYLASSYIDFGKNISPQKKRFNR